MMASGITIASVRHMVRVGELLGYPASELLSVGQLPTSMLLDPDASVSIHAFGAMWLALEERCGAVRYVTAHIEHMSPEVFGVSAHLMAVCGNLRHVVPLLDRYRPVIGFPIVPSIQVDDTRVVVAFPIHALAATRSRSWNDAEVLAVLSLLRTLTGRSFAPLEVRMSYQGEADATHEAWFGCLIRFGCAGTSVILPLECLDAPFVQPCESVVPYLRERAEGLLQSAASRRSYAERVVEVLPRWLTTSTNLESAVARELGVSERTLQRYLRSEGSSFGQLLEQTRRTLAERYLEDSKRSLAEVAILLGYSEVSSFSRAFKSWTGSSPRRSTSRDAQRD